MTAKELQTALGGISDLAAAEFTAIENGESDGDVVAVEEEPPRAAPAEPPGPPAGRLKAARNRRAGGEHAPPSV